jgi:hypothetical protein
MFFAEINLKNDPVRRGTGQIGLLRQRRLSDFDLCVSREPPFHFTANGLA